MMVATLTKKPQLTKQQRFIAKYQPNQIQFQIDCLDVKPEHVWFKMREIADSVRDHQKTCVYAGHSVSKDYEAARLALSFFYTHKPSTVVITGPANNQVENIFWREFKEAYNNAKIPLGGKLTTCKLELDNKWFVIAFTTDPDVVTQEATRFQGFHNDTVLVIFTEAAAIKSAVWKAAESLIIRPNDRWLVYGNPTSPQGNFADCENDPTWHIINISVKDTPNFKEGKEIIPGVSGREYEEAIRTKYGEESNEYAIRILGRKPEYAIGTYLGRELSKAQNDERIGTIRDDPTEPVFTFSDLGDMYSAWWFVQIIKEQIRLIDFYYDYEGKGLPYYAVMLQDKKYKYGGHWTLPDVFAGGSNQKAGFTGQYTVEVAHKLGIDFEKIELPNRNDCIRAAQDLLSICWFAPAALEGVEGLRDWRKRKNEVLSTAEKPVYYDEPLKTWGRHVGDAFCGLAIQYRLQGLTAREYIYQNSFKRQLVRTGAKSGYNPNPWSS